MLHSAVLKDWTLKAPYSHLAGGMKYHDGKLTVPIPGQYYIYGQIYYRGYKGKPVRISLLVNNKIVAMVHPAHTIRNADFTQAGCSTSKLVTSLQWGQHIWLG